MRKLITHFRSRGTRRMVGDVLKENERMLELARQLGFEVDPDAQDPDTARVVLALEAPSGAS
jgi:L-amino acid N-acyltransferase YncA